VHKLAALCVRRPVFASVLVLMLVVVGIFSYGRLGVDRFPDVDLPTINITTTLRGAAPEEIETEITDKIEEVVNTISGMDLLVSASSEGVSVVTANFVLEKNIDVAAQEVRDRVNTILADLPREADPPLIEKRDPDAAPILTVALSGPAPIRELTEFADRTLRRQLETVFGVGQVRLVGDLPRQINIVVDVAALNGYGLTVAQLVEALRSQNIQIPGGRVEKALQERTLRVYGRVQSPQEFANIAIAQRGGYVVKVGDVARIEDGVADAESVAEVNGQPAVVLQIRKQSGSNTVAVAQALRDRLAALSGQLPEGWTTAIVRDESEFIVAAVHTVQEHLVLGSFFASLIVWLFLRRVRPTIIAAIAIPSSLIATFGAMEAMGYTLNVITLLALTLAVGIVIDDAVVVLENIFRFMEEKKMPPMEAAVEGTREVGLAVLATSLSLIAVFLPVAFMGGLVGRFMASFGITMAFAVGVSLLVSFTLTPMMSSRWLRQRDMVVGSKAGRIYPRVEGSYLALLRWSLRHRWLVVLILMAVIGSIVPLGKMANKNFLPTDDESQFQVYVRAPEGTSLGATRDVLRSIAGQVRELPEVTTTLLTLGDDQQRSRNYGNLYVRLVPVSERQRNQSDLMDQVRAEILPRYERLQLRPQVAEVAAIGGGGTEAEIMFYLGGRDLGRLKEYADILTARLGEVPGVVDIDTNFLVGKPELGVRIDRARAADLSVRVEDIGNTLNVLVGGLEVTDYYEGGEQYEVHVRAAGDYRRDAQGIAQVEVPSRSLRVNGGGAGRVRLEDIVALEEGSGPSQINRISRQRQILILANMQPGYSSQTALDALNQAVAGLDIPAGYTYGFVGRSREQGKAAVQFGLAFLLSIIFMYLILAAQFESWIHPVTILLSLPLTIPFALLSIVVLDQSINIFSALGIVVLFGIVKKNGILQVDHMNGLRATGMPRQEAILEANRDRLRPILMTTLAFVAGMMPLVFSSGTGAGTNRAIGSVIAGGQTLSLVLSLIATPVAYSLFDDAAKSRLWRRLTGR